MSRRTVPLLLLIWFVTACASSGSPTATVTPRAELSGAAAHGAELFQGKGRCATCHALSPNTVIVGPSLAGIATRAESRVEGLSARDYLEESIISPDAYKAPGFEEQQMPTTLARELTVEEVEALVAYLLTLQ
ncbi:MAG: c-type cytochrome [Ardenticatenaceae bacterium]